MEGMDRMPDVMPVLSPGRHRNARRGACFMEFASYLAGERWSDHPACTHPAIATLARDVNDLSSDLGRAKLTDLIHRVVGLSSTDPRFGLTVALTAARAALPVASFERQCALAVAILSFEPELSVQSRAAFAQAPDLERWARTYLATARVRPHENSRTIDAIVHTAVTGIARACIPDPDARLHALLAETIEAAETTLATSPETPARQPALAR